MRSTKSPYPEWVTHHRKPGTEIRKMGDHYYVYNVSAYYDPARKKGRKKTGKYLGKITQQDGFIEATSRKVPKTYSAMNIQHLSTKDYGLYGFIQSSCKDLVDGLKKHFADQWEWVMVALYCRLVHSSPIKNMSYYYKRSYLSEVFDISVTGKAIGTLLRDLGGDRERLTRYMRQLSGDQDFILMDATSIVSYSRNLTRVEQGMTKYGSFEPLFNLLYFYCPDTYMPAYYRLFNGNIQDVKMVSMALEESGYKKALIIADKGFYSAANLKILEKGGMRYIIPLKRSSTLIQRNRYAKMTSTLKNFLFDERVIYHDSYPVSGGRKIYLYVDEYMMTQEKRDFIHRMKKHPQEYNAQKFKQQLPDFGSFAVITNQMDDAQRVFVNYKSRCGIEVLFDGVKNILENDHTYMHNDLALEGWMFINHLALQVHHKIYALLKEKKLLEKYSIRDFICFLADVRMVKINDQWMLEPLIDKQLKLIKDLGISIP